MKNLRTSWKLIALFAVAAVASTGYVVRSRAFTLIELQYLVPEELLVNQTAVVNVSNTSSESVEAVVDIYSGNGLLLKQRTLSVAAQTTLPVTYKLPAGAASNWIRAVVGLGTANVAVTDIGVINPTTGELVVIARGVQLAAPAFTELLPAVQLVAKQPACVFVANVSTDSVSGSIAIYAGNGTLLETLPITVAAGKTNCLMYTPRSPITIRAVVSLPNGGSVVSDLATFDVTSGNLIAILPFIELQ